MGREDFISDNLYHMRDRLRQNYEEKQLAKNGTAIDAAKLAQMLNCPVVETSAIREQGCTEVVDKVTALYGTSAAKLNVFRADIENALQKIESLLISCPESKRRYYAVKLFERDDKAISALGLDESLAGEIDRIVAEMEAENDDSGEAIIAGERYKWISGVISSVLVRPEKSFSAVSAKIDAVVTNRFLALPIFALVMFLVYYISITTVGTMGSDWVNEVLFGKWIPDAVNGLLDKAGVADWLRGLIVDGMIGGVGAVLGFLPQMLVLFCCLSFLEDCGYMSRVAFIMDRLFRCFGLSG